MTQICGAKAPQRFRRFDPENFPKKKVRLISPAANADWALAIGQSSFLVWKKQVSGRHSEAL